MASSRRGLGTAEAVSSREEEQREVARTKQHPASQHSLHPPGTLHGFVQTENVHLQACVDAEEASCQAVCRLRNTSLEAHPAPLLRCVGAPTFPQGDGGAVGASLDAFDVVDWLLSRRWCCKQTTKAWVGLASAASPPPTAAAASRRVLPSPPGHLPCCTSGLLMLLNAALLAPCTVSAAACNETGDAQSKLLCHVIVTHRRVVGLPARPRLVAPKCQRSAATRRPPMQQQPPARPCARRGVARRAGGATTSPAAAAAPPQSLQNHPANAGHAPAADQLAAGGVSRLERMPLHVCCMPSSPRAAAAARGGQDDLAAEQLDILYYLELKNERRHRHLQTRRGTVSRRGEYHPVTAPYFAASSRSADGLSECSPCQAVPTTLHALSLAANARMAACSSARVRQVQLSEQAAWGHGIPIAPQ